MPDAPERIYGWMNSQLSIARFYGAIRYNGHLYEIDLSDPEAPLVRADVLRREQRADLDRQAAEHKSAREAQGDIFGGAQ